MLHLPDLILDLGLILIAAAVVTLLFMLLKQPVVLGYLIAGFFVGPNFPLLPTVRDSANITIWAEIGVIFTLFSLGLEFSFKKLARAGKSATITATFEILTMLGLGYLVGQLLGWSKMDSIFLGGILSISSTTIIVRALEELNFKSKSFVSLVFGILIIEDLIAILLLVLLSSVAITQTLSGFELAYSAARLAFFLVLWFVLGIYLAPIFLKRFKSFLSEEILLIVSIGLCLMMVIIASQIGFSPALGAFVMGSILAETPKGKAIEHVILPVKNLFSAIFFVSVGMLINPQVLIEYFDVILLLSAVTILGKLFSSTLGALIAGENLKKSVISGLSLAQIGEFSFIIATLGMTLKVTSEFLYPIAVAVSAVTTFTTPYLIKFSDPIYIWLEKRIPLIIKKALEKYEIAMSSPSEIGALSLIWREYGIKVTLNSILVVALTLLMSRGALPKLMEHFGEDSHMKTFSCILTLILSTPFFWAIFISKRSPAQKYETTIIERLRRLQVGIVIFRFLIGFFLVGFLISSFTSIAAFSGILILVAALFGVLFLSRYSETIYQKIEDRFLSNLTENERVDLQKRSFPTLAPWNASLTDFTLSPNSPLIMKTLQSARIKEQFGVTVAMIERGETRIIPPKRDDFLLPFDRIYIIGTDDQLNAARPLIEQSPSKDAPPLSDTFGLDSLILKQNHSFIDKPIRECGLREASNGLIVGLERDGNRILSPDSSIKLQAGDLVWIVGELVKIRTLRDSP